MGWPTSLAINAWTGPNGPATGDAGAQVERWAVAKPDQDFPRPLTSQEPVDERNWRHPKVGWGLILPENEEISIPQRAQAVDALDPIRRLLESRVGSPVFRYRPDLNNQFLCRYYEDGTHQNIAISGSVRGIERGQIPKYLLIFGGPQDIPWSFQYVLNTAAFVGRLDLKDINLTRYVNALINDWDGAVAQPDYPVVWAADHGHPDITWLMRHAIATPVAEKLRNDSDIGGKVTELAGTDATIAALINAVKTQSPGLIVTTSHGMTGPSDNKDLMAGQLGFPVDTTGQLLQPNALLQQWQPDGAIWYAHACCSAGSDSQTNYEGLLEKDSLIQNTLRSVAGLGPLIAPLPQGLLGAEKPLRAFIGQVEPTFNWTIQQPDTGQLLTETIQKALYDSMYRQQPEPVGMAFQAHYRHVGQLFAQWVSARRKVVQNIPDAAEAALRAHLTAIDRQSMVILGDPTACISPLH